jgi:hypothetical protein
MSEMFDLYKEDIRLKRENVDVPEVSDLIESLSDDKALAITLYIFLMHDRTEENPLRDLPEKERSAEALTISKVDLNEYDDNAVSKAVSGYIKAKHNPIQKDIDVYSKKLYEFIDLLEETTPEIIKNIHDITGKVSYTTNVDIITTTLDNALSIIVEKSVLQEMKKTGKYDQRLRHTLSNKNKTRLLNKIKDDITPET